MNPLNLRNNRLKFKTPWKLLLNLEEFYGIYLKLVKKNRNITTCNQLDLGTLRSVFKIEVLIWISFWRALIFQPFSWRVGSNPRRPSNNIKMKYKTHIKPCAWITWYMFLVQCEELRIDHLTPLPVITTPYACWFLWCADHIKDFKWLLHFQFEVAFWKVLLREAYFERPNRIRSASKTSISNID